MQINVATQEINQMASKEPELEKKQQKAREHAHSQIKKSRTLHQMSLQFI